MGSPRRMITLLGRVSIGAGGDAPEAAGPRGRRAELVFAYLAAEHHRLVSNDELGDALWPEGLPDTWEAGLRGVLTEVRRFLTDGGLDPSQVLATGRGGHQLRLPADVALDLDIARDSLAAARAALAEGTAARAAEFAARASTLAVRPFLPSHEGEWVEGVRRQLDTTMARAIEVEARAMAVVGDAGAAAVALARLVQLEPFSEPAHQLRIRLLAQVGDRAGAIKAYEHCRGVLAAELGVEPSEETEATYRAAIDPRAAATGIEPPSTAFGDLSMLVVEDHDFQRRTAVMLLRKLGVGTITEANDGAAALDLLEGADLPDVILCDIDMPGMDGVEFIRHVAERELAGAVVIASGLDAKVIQAVQAVSEGYGLQVLGAVEKPLTARRLGDLLAAYRPRPRPRGATGEAAAVVSAADARAALRDGRIAFHLQPSVEVATGAVTAAAVVPRWHEPGLGAVPPAVFTALLEPDGLLLQLCARGVDVAGEQLDRLTGLALDVALSVDLPPESVHDSALADRVLAAVRSFGADPTRLTLALDERAFRHAPGPALGLLTRLRVKGCGVALTGFTTGHAPVEQLRGIPVTEVRLAPSLVDGATDDPLQARGLEEAIEVARALDVAIVGDGCDGEEHLHLLLGLGCDRLAGAYIAEAMAPEEFPDWIARWDPDRLGVGDG